MWAELEDYFGYPILVSLAGMVTWPWLMTEDFILWWNGQMIWWGVYTPIFVLLSGLFLINFLVGAKLLLFGAEPSRGNATANEGGGANAPQGREPMTPSGGQSRGGRVREEFDSSRVGADWGKETLQVLQRLAAILRRVDSGLVVRATNNQVALSEFGQPDWCIWFRPKKDGTVVVNAYVNDEEDGRAWKTRLESSGLVPTAVRSGHKLTLVKVVFELSDQQLSENAGLVEALFRASHALPHPGASQRPRRYPTAEERIPRDYGWRDRTDAPRGDQDTRAAPATPQDRTLSAEPSHRRSLEVKGTVVPSPASPSIGVRHNPSCGECKNAVHDLLRKLYGTVKREHKIDVSTTLESYRGKDFYPDLERIYEGLTEVRGFTDFVGNKSLPNCDFFVPAPGFVVELDELQHFTRPRSVTLSLYPPSLATGFDVARWRNSCDELNRKDSNPPSRDETRAWYDTLRDFLPVVKPGMGPTIRLRMGNVAWCQLDPESPGDVARFRSLLLDGATVGSQPVGTDAPSNCGAQVHDPPSLRPSRTEEADPGAMAIELDPSKIRVRVLEGPGARVARVVLTGSLARGWRSMSNPENARMILQKVAEAWPHDHPVDYLITFGGFQRFEWPFPGVRSQDEDTWYAITAHASAEAKKCLEGGVGSALAGHARYVTIGIDSSSVEHDHTKPEVELVGLLSTDGNEEHWTGKTKPVPSQVVGLLKAPLETHFQFVGGQHVVVLGCHDLNLFSPRAFANSSPTNREYLQSVRDRLAEWRPAVVLQHPHSTDSHRTWLQGWNGLRTSSGGGLVMAAGGVCHSGDHGKPPREPLADVLRLTSFGLPTLDFIVDTA